MSALESHPCRQLCNWRPVGDSDPELFHCLGCRSQWTAQERWTPAQADGQVPKAVIAERQRAERQRADPGWVQT